MPNNIINYLWELRKLGRAESTIETTGDRLNLIARQCNINEPETVKGLLATLKWENSTKRSAVNSYDGYLKFIGQTWTKPTYKPGTKIPFIPLETEIDQLIASAGKTTATLLQLLKETGMRIGEVEYLKLTDIDLERKTVNITPEKGSNPRILPITEKLKAMLNLLPRTTDNVFTKTKHTWRITYEEMRNRTAIKLNNPRLRKITFHTFRHWKGTTEYHKTKDIIHVKTILGHKDIKSTMIYIQIEQALYLNDTDEWTCKTATTVNEAIKLIETGFTKADEIDGIHLYKKRK